MKWYSLKLLIICIIIFIFQNIFENLTNEFSLNSSYFLFKPWTIVTYIFLHGSFQHLFYNMLALGLFGSILEKIIGSKKFLIVFFVSGIFAGIGSLIFYSSSIGASGAIYGILGVLAVLRPRMIVYFSFIPLPLALAVTFWAIGDLIGLFLPTDLIAYAAHLFGLIFGLLYGLKLRKKYGETIFRKKKEEINDKEFKIWEEKYMLSN